MMKLLFALLASLTLLHSTSTYSTPDNLEFTRLVPQDIQPSREFAFSPDGNLLAMRAKLEILLIDLRSGRVLHRLSGFTDEPKCFDFTKDQKKLLALGKNIQTKSSIISFEVETGKILNQSSLTHDFADGCAMSPDRSRFAVTGYNKLEIRDVETLNVLAANEFQPAESLAAEFVFLADGKTIVGAYDGHFKIIDTVQMKILRSDSFPGYPLKPYYNRDRTKVIFPNYPNDVVVLDTKSMTTSVLHLNGIRPDYMGWVSGENLDSLWAATKVPAVLYEFGFDGIQRRKIDISAANELTLFNAQQARAISFAKGGTLSQFDLRSGFVSMLGRYQDSSYGSADGFLPGTHTIRLDQYASGHTLLLDMDAEQSAKLLPRSDLKEFHTGRMYQITFDPNKMDQYGEGYQAYAETYDTVSGRMLGRIGLEAVSKSSSFESISVSPDGKFLYANLDIDSRKEHIVAVWNMGSGKIVRRFSAPRYISLFDLSADGKTLVICAGNDLGNRLLQTYETSTGKLLYEGETTTGPVAHMNIDASGRYLLLRGRSLEWIDLAKHLSFSLPAYWQKRIGRMSRTGESVLVANPDGRVDTYDLLHATPAGNSNDFPAPVSSILLKHPITGALYSSDDGLLALGQTDEGTTTIFNRKTGEEISLISGGDDWLLYDDEGNFDGSKGGTQLVGVTDKLRPIAIDQFAVSRNRPDLLMKRIGVGAPEMLAFFRKQHDLRLKRMGLTEEDVARSAQPPRAEILAQEQKGNELNLHFNCEAPQGSLRTAQVFVNDVPFYSGNGRAVSGSKVSIEEKIALGDGFNKIETSCTNDSGIEAFRALTSATAAPKQKPDLYVLAFGVSKYTTPGLELAYAAKDANDFAAGFDKLAGFSNVHTKVFLDEKVDGQNLAEAKALVSKASPSDVVAVFFAGHGSHDDDADQTYYLLTTASNVDNLSKTGLPFSSLEDLLKSTPARKRLMFIDACESGEAEESVVMASTSDKMKSRAIKRVKQTGASPALTPNWTRALLFAQDRIIFNDFRRRTGAFVFSSSRGGESSYEDSTIKNGYFTAALLQGLNDPEADKDGDKTVSLRELQRYVSQAVAERSKGAQHPTVDRDNLSLQLLLHGKSQP